MSTFEIFISNQFTQPLIFFFLLFRSAVIPFVWESKRDLPKIIASVCMCDCLSACETDQPGHCDPPLFFFFTFSLFIVCHHNFFLLFLCSLFFSISVLLLFFSDIQNIPFLTHDGFQCRSFSRSTSANAFALFALPFRVGSTATNT